MNIYVISDTHFGHAKMLEYEARPSDFEERIKKSVLSTVRHDDILIHLGDICFKNDREHNEWFQGLICQTWLVKGNHDHQSITFYSKYWDCNVDRLDLEIYGKKLVFTHRPIFVEEDQINIHGHCHSKPRDNELMNDERHLLVKMEHEYKPFNLRKLLKA